MAMKIEKGREYKRLDLHKVYKGNQQKGISIPAKGDIIMLFSSQKGESFGYEDGWNIEGFFKYSGEGQPGAMTWERKENRTLRDHRQLEYRVFLFIETKRSFYMCQGEFEVEDFLEISNPKTYGFDIQFLLREIDYQTEYERLVDRTAQMAADHERQGYGYNIPDVTERKGLVTSRVGQGVFRKQLIDYWGNKCAVTGYTGSPILIASHIVPWRDSTDRERVDVYNGILLSPLYDALFDKHLITFNEFRIIEFAPAAPLEKLKILGVTGDEQLRKLEAAHEPYLRRHRQRTLNNEGD
jgi:hypothetical protein